MSSVNANYISHQVKLIHKPQTASVRKRLCDVRLPVCHNVYIRVSTCQTVVPSFFCQCFFSVSIFSLYRCRFYIFTLFRLQASSMRFRVVCVIVHLHLQSVHKESQKRIKKLARLLHFLCIGILKHAVCICFWTRTRCSDVYEKGTLVSIRYIQFRLLFLLESVRFGRSLSIVTVSLSPSSSLMST